MGAISVLTTMKLMALVYSKYKSLYRGIIESIYVKVAIILLLFVLILILFVGTELVIFLPKQIYSLLIASFCIAGSESSSIFALLIHYSALISRVSPSRICLIKTIAPLCLRS